MPEQRWDRLFRTETIVSLGIAVMTVGGWILGWAEGVPWLVRIPAILLTFCAFVYLWDRHGSKVRSVLGISDAQAPPESNELAKADRGLQLHLSGGDVESRAETEEGQRGKFHVLKCMIHNPSDKTISNIKVILYCRSWKSGKFPVYNDTKPHHVKFDDGPLTLDPHMGCQITFFSQQVDDEKVIYLGDHNDQQVTQIGWQPTSVDPHFVTVVISAEDRSPTFKSLVVLTIPKFQPVPLEYDSRRWTHPEMSPNPFMTYPAPQQ